MSRHGWLWDSLGAWRVSRAELDADQDRIDAAPNERKDTAYAWSSADETTQLVLPVGLLIFSLLLLVFAKRGIY